MKIDNNKWVMACDPYKKVKWYHRVLKFFGKKIKIGTIGIFKWDKDRTVIEFVKEGNIYL